MGKAPGRRHGVPDKLGLEDDPAILDMGVGRTRDSRPKPGAAQVMTGKAHPPATELPQEAELATTNKTTGNQRV